ncbi:hypothetical protein D1872_238770 [compost metagenome]
MHTERTTLLIVRHRLYHRTKDVWVYLGPVKTTDVQKVGACNFTKPWDIYTPGEESSINIRKHVGPAWKSHFFTVKIIHIHSPENFTNHFMSIRSIRCAHLLNSVGKKTCPTKDSGIFGKKAKYKSSHEVVHFMTSFCCSPLRIIFQEFDIEPVQAACCTDIERTVTYLPYSCNPGKWQKKTKMIWKISIGTNERWIIRVKLLSLEINTIRGKDKSCFRFDCCPALFK